MGILETLFVNFKVFLQACINSIHVLIKSIQMIFYHSMALGLDDRVKVISSLPNFDSDQENT